MKGTYGKVRIFLLISLTFLAIALTLTIRVM